MIKSIKDTENEELMVSTLKSEGCFIVENFIQGESLNALREEVLNLCKKSPPYEFGKLYRGKPLSSYKKESAIYKTFHQEWMINLTKAYTHQPYGKSVIATHDYIHTKNWARQGWLHSDKQKSFKFFLYLTDIDKTCGALHLSSGSIKEASELNKKLKSKDLYESHRRLEETFPDLVKKYPPQPVEKPAGTLIVFDSDTFHKGGVVEKGKERLIIRLHSK